MEERLVRMGGQLEDFDAEDPTLRDSLRESGVVVAKGASGGRVLVIVTAENRIATVTVVGEQAIEAGLLDTLTGRSLGTTMEDVYRELTGVSLVDGDPA